MRSQENNYAFIDSQNLNLNIKLQGWSLDFAKFRKYLEEKYGVKKAFIFIGFIQENQDLYHFLKRCGYICIFKPVIEYRNGETKGNCDAELVLQTMIQLESFDKAVIVSGDGDFYCLIEYLLSKQKLKVLMVPNNRRYSALFKRGEIMPFLRFIDGLKDKLIYTRIKKTP